MRKAKERKRVERVNTPIDADALNTAAQSWSSSQPTVRPKRSGFRITIECLDDNERTQFITARGPHGLLVSPTDSGRRVTAVLLHYQPASLSLGMARAIV